MVPTQEINKHTWGSPGRELRGIIDNFLVRKDNRVRVEDVKAVRAVEIGSDHYLVLFKMSRKSRMERCRGLEENVRIRIDRLKDRRVRL